MKSYRQVLQSKVPEGQRRSARALVQFHGLPSPGSLRALIQKLEGSPPPPPPPPPPPTPVISASIEFGLGGLENRVLRITGNGFTPAEEVTLQITTKVDSDNPFTGSAQTTADNLGFIDFKQGVFCAVNRQTTFQVQASGLSSSKRSNVTGASC